MRTAHNPDGSLEWVFDYDAMGRVISKTEIRHTPEEVKTTCYAWSPLGQLGKVEETSLNDGSGWIWTARYDGLGRRLKTNFKHKNTTAEALEISSYYDPETLFLELGRSYLRDKKDPNDFFHRQEDCPANTFWKLYKRELKGPDEYTLEGVLTQEKYMVLTTDVLGDIVAGLEIDPSRQLTLDINIGKYRQWLRSSSSIAHCAIDDFLSSFTWKCFSEDPTGLIWLGEHYYDPLFRRIMTPDSPYKTDKNDK